MLDCSDGLYFDPAPVPRRRPRTVPISVVFEGVGGSLIVDPIGRVPPPTDRPPPGLAEATWITFLRELVDILCEAWAALGGTFRNIQRREGVMPIASPRMES